MIRYVIRTKIKGIPGYVYYQGDGKYSAFTENIRGCVMYEYKKYAEPTFNILSSTFKNSIWCNAKIIKVNVVKEIRLVKRKFIKSVTIVKEKKS